MALQLNINSDAIVRFTDKLERLHRSDLPIAIRDTLNNAAFDVKQKTMPATSKRTFTNRHPNFFKSTSRVTKATGFDVRSMKSMVGFVGNQQAVRDLEAQEHGGKIGGRAFIPVDTARAGGSRRNMVESVNRMKRIRSRKIIDTKNSSAGTAAARFGSSIRLARKGGLILAEYKGKRILWRVNSRTKTEGGNYKLTALYTYKEGRDVRVSGTDFMRTASLRSGAKMEEFFIKQASARIKKRMASK